MLKNLFYAVSIAVLAAGCTNGGGSYFLTQTKFVQSDCTISEIGLAEGSVNLGVTSSYIVGISVVSDAVGDPVTIDGRLVSSTSPNDFVVQEIAVNYLKFVNGTTTPLTIPTQHIPYSGSFAAGAGDGSWLTANVITTDAATALRAEAMPFTLVVEITARGVLRGGLPAATNTLRFPITVTNTAPPACPAPGTLSAGAAPCGNAGQDGTNLTCSCPTPTCPATSCATITNACGGSITCTCTAPLTCDPVSGTCA